jgi:hypothetical protein
MKILGALKKPKEPEKEKPPDQPAEARIKSGNASDGELSDLIKRMAAAKKKKPRYHPVQFCRKRSRSLIHFIRPLLHSASLRTRPLRILLHRQAIKKILPRSPADRI